ncbi:MAG: ABC transporter permease [bacterium]|nr:ABC transporter permease [bacterium]
MNLFKITLKRIRAEKITSLCLIVGLVISMLMVSICTSFIAEISNAGDDKMEYAPPDGLMFNSKLEVEEKVELSDLLKPMEQLKEGTGVIFNGLMVNVDGRGVDTYTSVSAEWFQDDTVWHYPIMEGRYYTTEEIKNSEKVIVVGKDILNNTYLKNAKKYIKIMDEEYLVIGVVGFKGKRSLWDSRVFMPVTALPEYTENDITDGDFDCIFYTSDKTSESEINTYIKELKTEFPNYSVSALHELETDNVVDNIMVSMDILFIISMLGYVVSLMYSVNMVSFWIAKRQFEISVRKAFGYTNKAIGKMIFKEMFGLCLLSFVIATMIQGIVSIGMNSISNYTLKLYHQNIIVGLVVVLFTAFLTSIWPIVKTLKIQPIEVIKG